MSIDIGVVERKAERAVLLAARAWTADKPCPGSGTKERLRAAVAAWEATQAHSATEACNQVDPMSNRCIHDG